MTEPGDSRGTLAAQVFRRLAAGLILLLAAFFLPAGTVAYWEAWVYLAILFTPMTIVFVFLLRNNRALLERRMKLKEQDSRQSALIKLGSVFYVFTFLLPGFDRRFGWSDVPAAAAIAADVLFLLGYGLFVLVLRENSFASRVVEVQEGQRVITTGPYAVIRHPMYLAVLVMLFATPVALGSWWALIPAVPLLPVLIARIRSEEIILLQGLAGYREYTLVTRHRLIPGVW